MPVVCLGVSEVGTTAARFYHMLSAASATGEYEKVCHGEHHCQCKYVNIFSSSVYVWCTEQLLHTSSLSSVIIGLFENYLNIRFKDPNFEAVSPSISLYLPDVFHVLFSCHRCVLVWTGWCSMTLFSSTWHTLRTIPSGHTSPTSPLPSIFSLLLLLSLTSDIHTPTLRCTV